MFIFSVNYGKVHAAIEVEGGNTLPRAGYLSICVTEEVYNCLQTNAKKTNSSIPEYIKHLIEMEKVQEREH
jgi:hypothetical protein